MCLTAQVESLLRAQQIDEVRGDQPLTSPGDSAQIGGGGILHQSYMSYSQAESSHPYHEALPGPFRGGELFQGEAPLQPDPVVNDQRSDSRSWEILELGLEEALPPQDVIDELYSLLSLAVMLN